MNNILGTEKITKLIFKMSIPTMISMLIQALYNIIDSIFVARVSEEALSSVSLSFSVQLIILALALGIGVGTNSIMSRKLGEGDQKRANSIANTSVTMALISYVIIILIGLFAIKPYFNAYSDNQEIVSGAITYSKICSFLSIGIFISIAIEKIIQATGNAVYPMIVQMTGAIINIILDPIFIFTLGLGVKGAAIATVIGQLTSMFIALYFLGKNKYVKVNIKSFNLNKDNVKYICIVGVPTMIMNCVGTVMVSWMNIILINISAVAVNVLGIYFKLQSFFFMPVFGLNSGIIPIIGFNYGYKNKERIVKTLILGICIALGIMITGFIILQLFSPQLLSLFSADKALLEVGVPALRAISFCFIPAAVCIILIASFQATGFGVLSMIITLLRQLGILCPSAMLLIKFCGNNYVWYSFFIAEIVAAFICFCFFINLYKTKIATLKQVK